MPFLFVPFAAAAALSEVRVSVRAGDRGEATCVVRDAAGRAAPERLAPAGAGHWLWTRSAGDVLACSSPGFEPLDAEAGPAPPAQPEISLELSPSRPVTLLGEWHSAGTTVEWRRMDAGATTLLARQPVLVRGTVTLPVALESRVPRLPAAGLA